jgi:hypothetical protein
MNARLQAQAIALGGSVTYLEKEEGEKADIIQQQVVMRPWELWKAKALAAKWRARRESAIAGRLQ